MLAGSRELIDEAWRWKQQWGGAFRQSGIVAAGCLHALDHHVERLAEDHDNARVLAEGLLELGLRRDHARDQHRHLQRAGRVRRADGRARRAAERHAGRPRPGGTHLDVGRDAIDSALLAARDSLLP